MQMHDAKGTDWREQYTQVLFKADPEKLQMGIEAAHEAVQHRICALWDGSAGGYWLTQLAYASRFRGLVNTITEQNQKAEGPIYSTVRLEERRT
jgi:hypothetical protein